LLLQAAVIAIEESSEQAAAQMTAVLNLFTTVNIITPDEFTKVGISAVQLHTVQSLAITFYTWLPNGPPTV
jgi:hypothetical protein